MKTIIIREKKIIEKFGFKEASLLLLKLDVKNKKTYALSDDDFFSKKNNLNFEFAISLLELEISKQ